MADGSRCNLSVVAVNFPNSLHLYSISKIKTRDESFSHQLASGFLVIDFLIEIGILVSYEAMTQAAQIGRLSTHGVGHLESK